ncbi:MAG TPA: sigma-70 family RNA polymerase sigma factor [Thermoleophilaceae bacterium]
MTPRRLIEPARLAGAALLHTQTDERLVDLTRAGNDRAFEAVVVRYRRPLLRYCRRLLPPERAEDAVQQTFLNAYRAIGAGEAELNLRPWLYRIAHNASMSLLRQNGWSHEELDERFDGVMQPPQAFEERERVREVMRAVRELPPRQRDAMVLRELEGRSYEEIALALGVSGGAVRQLLNRARTTLRSAATAVTPFELVAWLAARGPGAVPAGERIAELCAAGGAGGVAVAAKLGTAVLVAGAVAGGATGAGPLPDAVGGGSDGSDRALAAEADGSGGPGERRDDTPGRGPDEDGDRSGGGEDDRDDDDDDDEGDGPGGSGPDDDDSSGSGSGSDDDSDSSGSGSGDDDSDSGGSGPDGEGGGGSGSGSSGSGSSGSGSGSGGSGSSGSGSGSSGSGSTSSGSGSGSGSSGSGSGSSSSGSGSSGSGSASSGSGSGSGSSGTGSTGSDSGSTGSGSDSGSSGSGSGSSSGSGSGTSGSGD